jgi:hypothetical protein
MMRLLQTAAFVAGLVVVFFVSVRLLPGTGDAPQGNIRIVARLDDYTRKSNPRIANTIPTFLTQPGRLGAVPPTAAAAPEGVVADPASGEAPAAEPAAPPPVLTTHDITPVNEVELQKGFCTATLVGLIRQRYPGSYDHMPDAELEKTVLETRPEYRDRVCVLPVWITADPRDIVKYEVEAAGPLGGTRFFFAGIITAVFGLSAGAAILRFRN